MKTFARTYAREVAFFIALIATAGSLITSILFGWEPCGLCTTQRVFMYPLVAILGWSLFSGKELHKTVLLLPLFGAGVSLYHHLLVRFDPTQGCGFALPCSMDAGIYFGSFGVQPMYLPLSAFIAFVLILALLSRRIFSK